MASNNRLNYNSDDGKTFNVGGSIQMQPGAKLLQADGTDLLTVNSSKANAFTAIPVGIRRNARLDACLSPNFILSSSAVAANTTFHMATLINNQFNSVEPFFANITASPFLYDAIAVASSASFATPSAPDGPWSVAASGVTVPAGSSGLPSFKSPGVLACRGITRTDGGSGFPLAIRAFMAATTPTFSYYGASGQGLTEYNNNNPRNPQYGYTGSGNTVTSSQGTFAPTVNPFIMPAFWKMTYDKPVVGVLVAGDSIHQGFGQPGWPAGSSPRYSPAAIAVNILQQSGMPIEMCNTGISGSQFAVFGPIFKAVFDIIKPQVVTIPSYTPNQAHVTQADADLQWQNSMDLAQYARAAGAAVILITPYPIDANTLAYDALRLQLRDRVMASGFPFVDVEPITSNYATPARWQTGASPDGIHPYPAINLLIGSKLAQVIASL